MSLGLAPSGATTVVSMPCSESIRWISITSSLHLNPSNEGPSILTFGLRPNSFHHKGLIFYEELTFSFKIVLIS